MVVTRLSAPLSLLLALSACNPEEATETTRKMAEDAADASKKMADVTVEGTRDVVDGTKQAVDSVTEEANRQKDEATALYRRITDTGELSKSASAWLEAQAGQGEMMEQVIVKGTQIAPVALEVGTALNGAVESDTAIEPIYQKIGPASDPAAVDAAIEKMPRVEVIDGVTVGFRHLDTLETDRSIKERAYLVTWRRDDHLVGFVYRSTRTIDLEKLVAETPRLVALTRTALQDGD